MNAKFKDVCRLITDQGRSHVASIDKVFGLTEEVSFIEIILLVWRMSKAHSTMIADVQCHGGHC